MKQRIKILKPVGGYKAGEEIRIECDQSGTPLDKYWRRRLRDSKRDNCIEFVGDSLPKKAQKEYKEVKVDSK